MSEMYQRLAHSSWDCKYHVVFVPKRRRKVLFGQARRKLGEVFHALARQKECQIIEGHLLPDHVHMCIAIPPKYPVASVIGFEREERHSHCPLVWQRAEFHGRALLGPRLRRLHGRVRLRSSPPIHPRTRVSGWNRALLNSSSKARFSATPKPTGRPPLRRPHSPSHPLCGGCLTLGLSYSET